MLGATLICLSTALYLNATAEIWRGFALLLWEAVAVGPVDNFVRPLVLDGRVEVPTLPVVFALLGVSRCTDSWQST